jgi:hypothetical protein
LPVVVGVFVSLFGSIIHKWEYYRLGPRWSPMRGLQALGKIAEYWPRSIRLILGLYGRFTIGVRQDGYKGKGCSLQTALLLQVLLSEDGIGSVVFLFSFLTLLCQFVCFLIQVGLGRVFAFGSV